MSPRSTSSVPSRRPSALLHARAPPRAPLGDELARRRGAARDAGEGWPSRARLAQVGAGWPRSATAREHGRRASDAAHAGDMATGPASRVPTRDKVSAVPDVVCPQCGTRATQTHKFCPVCGFPIAEFSRDSPTTRSSARTLPGGYVILELVGVGGMGRVYRAEQTTLGRTVAVKIIHPHLLGDESAVGRASSPRRARRAASTIRTRSASSTSARTTTAALPGDGVPARAGPRARRLRRGAAPVPAHRRRPAPGARRARRSAPPRHHPPRSQAREHHPRADALGRRLREGRRLRPRQDAGRGRARPTSRAPASSAARPTTWRPSRAAAIRSTRAATSTRCGVILFQLLTGRLPFEADTPDAGGADAPLDAAARSARGRARARHPRARSSRSRCKALAEGADASLPERRRVRRGAARARSRELEAPSGALHARRRTASTARRAARIVPRGQKFCGECGARDRAADAPPSRRAGARCRGGRERALEPARALPLPVHRRARTTSSGSKTCRAERRTARSSARASSASTASARRASCASSSRRAPRAGDIVVETGPDPWWAEVGYYALRRAIVGLAGCRPTAATERLERRRRRSAARPARDLRRRQRRRRRGTSGRSPAGASRPTTAASSPPRRCAGRSCARSQTRRRAAASSWPSTIFTPSTARAATPSPTRSASRRSCADARSSATHSPGFDPGWRGASRARAHRAACRRASRRGARSVERASSRRDAATRAPSIARAATVPPLYVDQLLRFTSRAAAIRRRAWPTSSRSASSASRPTRAACSRRSRCSATPPTEPASQRAAHRESTNLDEHPRRRSRVAGIDRGARRAASAPRTRSPRRRPRDHPGRRPARSPRQGAARRRGRRSRCRSRCARSTPTTRRTRSRR